MANSKPKPQESKRPVGRPSTYNPEYCDEVIELGRQGKSPAQIAATLGVDRQTLHNWADANPEFFAALTRAKTFEQAFWEDEGFKGMKADKFNATVWTKSMQARFRDDYTERQETKHSGAVQIERIERHIVDPNPTNSDRTGV